MADELAKAAQKGGAQFESYKVAADYWTTFEKGMALEVEKEDGTKSYILGRMIELYYDSEKDELTFSGSRVDKSSEYESLEAIEQRLMDAGNDIDFVEKHYY